jgi:inorganic pyrophosphatase
MSDKNIVVIEIPRGSEVKYEICKSSGKPVVDRFLPMRCPANYGFYAGTLCEDGDPLDVFVLAPEPLLPGCSVTATPIGVIKCLDAGLGDDKIIAVAANYSVSGIEVENAMSDIFEYLNNYKPGFAVVDDSGARSPELASEAVKSSAAHKNRGKTLALFRFLISIVATLLRRR